MVKSHGKFPMADSGQQLGRRFEEHLMKRRICELTDIEDVKKVAVGLVELNFQMKDQLKQWAGSQVTKA